MTSPERSPLCSRTARCASAWAGKAANMPRSGRPGAWPSAWRTSTARCGSGTRVPPPARSGRLRPAHQIDDPGIDVAARAGLGRGVHVAQLVVEIEVRLEHLQERAFVQAAE